MTDFDIICLALAITLIVAGGYGYAKIGDKGCLFPMASGFLLLVATLATLGDTVHISGIC